MHALLTEWIFQQGVEVEAETLFVFGTAHHQQEFAERILAIWREKRLRHIVISGHAGEAAQMARLACGLGVPEHLFALESRAGNTLENVQFSQELLRQRCDGPSLYLLCKRHAAARCLLTVATVFPEWAVYAYTVDYFGVGRSNWLLHRRFVDKAREELTRTLEYCGRGDIAGPARAGFDAAQLRAALHRMEIASAAHVKEEDGK